MLQVGAGRRKCKEASEIHKFSTKPVQRLLYKILLDVVEIFLNSLLFWMPSCNMIPQLGLLRTNLSTNCASVREAIDVYLRVSLKVELVFKMLSTLFTRPLPRVRIKARQCLDPISEVSFVAKVVFNPFSSRKPSVTFCIHINCPQIIIFYA